MTGSGSASPTKLVILDRDGVINRDSDAFIKTPEEWAPLPGSLDAIARMCEAGFTVAVATNQSGVARGLLTLDTLERIHARMREKVREHGGAIAEIAFCPHGPDEGCDCRKPEPGMLYEIARQFGVSLAGVHVVGDSERDLLAARRAKASPVLVLTGKGRETHRTSRELGRVPVFDDLARFADALLSGDVGPT